MHTRQKLGKVLTGEGDTDECHRRDQAGKGVHRAGSERRAQSSSRRGRYSLLAERKVRLAELYMRDVVVVAVRTRECEEAKGNLILRSESAKSPLGD